MDVDKVSPRIHQRRHFMGTPKEQATAHFGKHGGIIGGVLLEHSGVASFSPAALALLMPCALVVFANRQSAFRSHETG